MCLLNCGDHFTMHRCFKSPCTLKIDTFTCQLYFNKSWGKTWIDPTSPPKIKVKIQRTFLPQCRTVLFKFECARGSLGDLVTVHLSHDSEFLTSSQWGHVPCWYMLYYAVICFQKGLLLRKHDVKLHSLSSSTGKIPWSQILSGCPGSMPLKNRFSKCVAFFFKE